jgi:hypothetical protein
MLFITNLSCITTATAKHVHNITLVSALVQSCTLIFDNREEKFVYTNHFFGPAAGHARLLHQL